MAGKADAWMDRLVEGAAREFEGHRRILSMDAWLELVLAHPTRFSRSAAQYIRDAIAHLGVDEVERFGRKVQRWRAFDLPHEEGRDPVVSNEDVQMQLMRALENFEREGRVHRFLLLHGPNGSAKSSFVAAIISAMEAYSRTEEGALYRFHWVFPGRAQEGSRIGFGSRNGRSGEDSFAYLDDAEIDARLPGEAHDNPLYLLPREERAALLREALPVDQSFRWSEVILEGELSHRSRQVFEALLTAHHGDLRSVLRHVQIERYYVNARYREGAVTVEPQLRVDAQLRQLTMDRSLNALPSILQSRTLFEVAGPLAEGNRGLIEYNDMLKRPMEANKYLLATSEKGVVSLDNAVMQLDALLVGTTNDTYLEAFKQQPDWPSWKGRIELIRMGYLVDFRAEARIYQGVIDRLGRDVEVAPHSAEVCALWAVMTRLRRPQGGDLDASVQKVVGQLSPVEKALLYADGTTPAGLTAEQAMKVRSAVADMVDAAREPSWYEGRLGASPREMKQILVQVLHDSKGVLTPTQVLKELRELIRDHSVYEWLRLEPDGAYHRPERFLDDVRSWWLDRVLDDVRRCCGLVDEAEYIRLFDRYVTHANHWLRNERLVDPTTGQTHPPDEAFLADMEKRLGADEEPRAFRSNLLSRIAAFRIDHPEERVAWERIFPRYLEDLRRQYFREKQSQIATLVEHALQCLDGTQEHLGKDAQAAAESLISALVKEAGYTRKSLREPLALVWHERLIDGLPARVSSGVKT